MKWWAVIVAAVWGILPLAAPGAQTAQARMWCLSLRFQQGADSFGDTLDLSTVAGTPNGELAPYNGDTYGSGFALGLYSGVSIYGTIYVNLPPYADANGNGFDDFFEVALAAGGTTTGTYTTAIGGGTVTASWSRAAGSRDGSCVFDLKDNTYGDLGSYQDTFELIEYTGPLAYTPGSNTVNGAVALRQTGNAANQLQGPVQFVKVATNRFNLLVLQPGTWTNAAAQTLGYTNALFLRDVRWPTNYYGYLEFADGDPDTPAPDYLTWMLSIDDTNDINRNGIPDFSDDPSASQPPRAPLLRLTLGTTNLWLSISGDVGRVHEVQQTTALPATNWQAVLSLTLTNDPQMLSLPLPAGTPSFWRVRTQ